MEPICQGCSTPISELDKYWILESNVKGRYQWHKAPGPTYCEVCMSKMVFLLQRDFLQSSSEEES